MDQPNLTSLILKYKQAIPEKEAEQKLAKLLYDYRKALEALQGDVASQHVVKAALDIVTGNETRHISSAEEQYARVIKHFQNKGREIASEYIKDPTVIETIEREWNTGSTDQDEQHDGQLKITEQAKNHDRDKETEIERKRSEMLRQLKEQQERNEKTRDKDYERG